MTDAVDSAHSTRAVKLLTHARLACEPILRDAVGSLPDTLARMAGYHFGWNDTNGHPAQIISGKALRPALVLAVAAAGADRDAGGAAAAAAAVELIHNCALVQDDVMDDDPIRRGRAAVWKVWGAPHAIVLGDALHGLAARVLVEFLPAGVLVEAVTRLEQTIFELCEGQAQDCAFESRAAVSMDEYLAMAMGKTGSLLGCACALGALCGGGDSETVAAMDRFGRQLGLSFQFVDDLIGIWGDSAVTGKPVGGDLVRRKHSMPVVAARASNTPDGRELRQLLDSANGEVDAARATRLIEATGARDWVRAQADRQLSAALETIPPQLHSADLESLARFVAQRNW